MLEAGTAVERPPLRVALLLDSTQVPAWTAKVVQSLAVDERVDLVATALNASQNPPSFAARVRRLRRFLVYEAYIRLERRLFPSHPSPFERVDISTLLAETLQVQVHPTRSKHVDRFDPEAIEALRACNLDVAIRFGFRILHGHVLEVPRLGVWSYHHDDPDVIRGAPPGFWEVMNGHPVTGCVVQRLSEELDGGEVLARCTVPTRQRSVARNKQHLYWTGVGLMADAVRDAWRGESSERHTAERPPGVKLHRKPRNLRMSWLAARHATRVAVPWVVDRLSRKTWLMAYAQEDQPTSPAPSVDWIELRPPRGFFWADPFPVHVEGHEYDLFFEEYSFRKCRGRLMVGRLRLGQGLTNVRPILEARHHLSYPNVFTWEGEHYLLPEQSAVGKVALYRATRYPDEWEVHAELITGERIVDPTIYRDQQAGVWWLFVGQAPAEVTHAHDALHLYRASELGGPWVPHDGNPVVRDCRSARPAGQLFEHGGRLFRPSQDCSRHYGSAVVLNEVLNLSPNHYRERAGERIRADWASGLIGTHTVNRAPGLVVVDGLRRTWLH